MRRPLRLGCRTLIGTRRVRGSHRLAGRSNRRGVVALAVLVGGIKSIAKVSSGFVPIMIVFYVVGAIWILIVNIVDVPAAIALIFTDAFSGTAAVGGFAGSALILAVQMGVARGAFSNESGMGSAAIAASSRPHSAQ